MKTLIIYDSAYGNTEKVARAMGQALDSTGEVEVVRAADVQPGQLSGVALLIVGSPTQKFRPLAPVTNFVKGLPNNALRGVKVAAFDTRIPTARVQEVRILAFFVKLFGYAAKPIADRLAKKGGELVAPPEGFYVSDTEGPLVDGELERAADWARKIAAAV